MLYKKKSRSIIFIIVCFWVICFSLSSAIATPINLISWNETPTTLSVEWGWNPEAMDSNGKTGSDWWAYLKIEDGKDIDVTHQNEWYVHWEFQHLTAPHTGEVAPAPLFVAENFFNKNDYGVVIDKSGSFLHPAFHSDDWTFKFDRSMVPDNTRVILNVTHTPEPTTMLLFGFGFLGLLGIGGIKKKV